MQRPNKTEIMIKMTLSKPSVRKDTLIKMVDIIKPEFLIILWKKSELKNENNNKNTSTKISNWNSSSKKILFKDLIFVLSFI